MSPSLDFSPMGWHSLLPTPLPVATGCLLCLRSRDSLWGLMIGKHKESVHCLVWHWWWYASSHCWSWFLESWLSESVHVSVILHIPCHINCLLPLVCCWLILDKHLLLLLTGLASTSSDGMQDLIYVGSYNCAMVTYTFFIAQSWHHCHLASRDGRCSHQKIMIGLYSYYELFIHLLLDCGEQFSTVVSHIIGHLLFIH